ncbi:HEPN domain-containing protein [Bacillus cereus group sp. BfR-BA-01355]|uniref:HEPN domain-containing protein n=1 Tax=Bacillus cereus group sp. BfR-BA-01355 TaxID=2920318 RepID=UPI001F5A7305|nr:HEPN domain-containing protein [Bacillus cereus group sp. BfR-BA-01355]
MINPFNKEIFQTKFSIPGFRESSPILSILVNENSILRQYLVLKSLIKEEYIILGFDFKHEQIIPIENSNINYVLNEIQKFISSKFNSINLNIEALDKNIEYFSKQKLKKSNFYTNENITIFVSSQRNIIPTQCEIYSNEVLYSPNKSIVIHNRSGLLYGEIEFDGVQKNDFLKLHFSETLILKYYVDNEIIETASIIYEVVSVNSNSFVLILSNFIHDLSNMRVNHSSQTLNPHSAFFEVLRTAGISKEQINIKGFEKTNAPYLIIIPIEDLEINIKEFGLGDITFLSKQESFNRVKGFEELFVKELNEEFNVFAHTIVESENTYDAYLLGLQKIQQAVDVLVHLTKNERTFNFFNLGDYINNWSRSRIYQHPKCSTFYYAENIIGFEKVFSDSKKIRCDNSLEIDSYLEKIIEELDWYEHVLYRKLQGEESKIEKQLFNALKWLSRSWRTNNIEDKVIYTSIAMEFLVDEVKTEPYIPKQVKSEFKGLLKNLLKNNAIFTEDISKKIIEKSLQGLSEPPLKIKVKTLIEQLKVPINEEEFEKIWSVRNYRNDMVHGRSELEINPDIVLLANIFLGELIAYRFKDIEDGVQD